MNRYLLPVFLVLISGAIYVLYIDVLRNEILQQRAKEKDINAFLVQAKDARGKLDAIEAQYKAFPIDADKKLNVIFPDQIDDLKMIIDINTIAKQHGLEVIGPSVNKSVDDTKSTAKFKKYSLQFKVTSTYPVFYAFLKSVEKSLAIRDFTGVNFNSTSVLDPKAPTPRPELAIYDYQVELTSYALN